MDKNKIQTLLVLLGVLLGLWGISNVRNEYAKNQSLKQELITKRKRAAAVKSYNKTITNKINAQQLYVVTQNTINKATDFYDLFFNWSSWSQYGQNLTVINKQFPVVAKQKVVDTSSFTIGSGTSGTSTYEINNTFISPTKGSIVQLVTQIRQFDTTSATTQWFITSRSVGKNKLEITSMNPIQADK